MAKKGMRLNTAPSTHHSSMLINGNGNSEIAYYRRAPYLNGHDGILQDLHQTENPSPAEHAEI
ncbi:hypothetical protein AC578_2140 [Pseudocercospora eumusae]|uniref:Uncharacterized protein n=1 Tax=Pseudocercospora eumusae TaxID=321146 RepID=A0A139HQG8_9PEZI|nr:hypothetical protein AC578_2140 [Pseudocercospora eumusae]